MHKGVSRIEELEDQIREYINDYRLRHVLLQNEARWNVLTSSLDVIGDTELAIASYKPLNESSDTGFRY